MGTGDPLRPTHQPCRRDELPMKLRIELGQLGFVAAVLGARGVLDRVVSRRPAWMGLGPA